jgi:hypothetical protein
VAADEQASLQAATPRISIHGHPLGLDYFMGIS